MSFNYSGNPANVTTPISATVTGCSSGTSGLVMVQTSAAHNFATSDYVTITGVVGTTEANTTAKITVVDATHFLLQGVTFVNAYVSGGTAKDRALTPYGTLPGEGEAATAASIESFIQMLADRTQYLQRQLSTTETTAFTANGNATAPWWATFAAVTAYGGGGGGAGGCNGDTTVDSSAPGGGGGGGAVLSTQIVPVTGGSTYAVSIGAGGAGGTAGNAGSNGTPTTFGSLATFLAASGAPSVSSLVVNIPILTYGGTPAASIVDTLIVPYTTYGSSSNPPPVMPQCGGPGLNGFTTFYSNAWAGGRSPQGQGGTAGGGSGGTSGSYPGGGGAGGGGAGPAGAGGTGGNGGAGNNAGTGSNGTAGANAAANTGGGGGGGGAGGQGSGAGGNAATGGNGGSGGLTVTWLR